MPERVTIRVDDAHGVSGLFVAPPRACACLLLAHGAGAGMTHTFMHAVAHDLAGRGIASLRYQFPYMEQGGSRPDAPRLAHATVRAGAARALELAPALPLFAGGKSFGGRMTSQAQAASALPQVLGLIFLGFPLHPSKRPSDARAGHLSDVKVPMLFVQGTRDTLAEAQLLASVAKRIGERASLHFIRDADHSFRLPASSRRTDADALRELLDSVVAWIKCVSSASSPS